MRKILVFIFIVSCSLNGYSQVLGGFSDINSAVKGFFDPLRQGSKNIDQAMTNMPEENRMNADAGIKNNDSSTFRGKLYQVMATDQQGGVVDYKETGSKSVLNGSYVTKTYEVRFRGGKVKTIQFKFLRPTTGEEYQFVEASMD